MTTEVIGALLAGGRSRRLGGQKATLEIGGRTLVDRASDSLRSAGLEVALVLRAQQPVPGTAHAAITVRDNIEDAGPLGGMQALIQSMPTEWALFVPCDQPFLAPALLRELLAQPRRNVDAVLGKPGPFLEPLPGLYRRTCLSHVEDALARGERSFRDLLARLRIHVVSEATLRRVDRELLSYLNVNTPADLARAQAIADSVRDSIRQN